MEITTVQIVAWNSVSNIPTMHGISLEWSATSLCASFVANWLWQFSFSSNYNSQLNDPITIG